MRGLRFTLLLLFVLIFTIDAALADTGGTITYNATHTIHTFTSSGTYTPSSTHDATFFVVAGGGGGGGSNSGFCGGGGGAGGLIIGTHQVNATGYTVTVGAGGAGGAAGDNKGNNGTDSSVGSFIYAIGGGGAGFGKNQATPDTGKNGGSGGGVGGAQSGTTGTAGTQVNGVGGTNYNNNGGTKSYSGCGGGGGGAGSAGPTSGSACSTTSLGGNGYTFDSTYYAYGGNGTSGATTGVSAGANTGAGGGGACQAYAGGSGGSGIVIISYVTTDPTPYAAERLQQDVTVYQNGSVTVASASYVPIVTASVNASGAAGGYAVATVPITGGASSNTATCRITYDGAEFGGSEASRSVTAGASGNLILSSRIENITAGAHDLGVECLRVGGSNFVVTNTTVLGHLLISPSGENLTYAELNLSGSAGSVFSTTLTTSGNYTASGLVRALVADWSASYSYSSTGNITLTPEIAGTNCSSIIRYGSSGSTGSASSACYVNIGNETNSTTYNIKVHSTGSGTIDGWLRVKEMILHPSEINSTDLTGTTISGSDTTSIVLGAAAGHSTPDLIAVAGVNPVSLSGSQSTSFYLSAGGQNSSVISRTVGLGQAGSVVAQDVYSSFTNLTVSLISSCTSCELVGGELLAYISSDFAATPNSFIVQANNLWSGSALSEFAINLSDGRSFSTTTGSIEVPATGQLLNISAVENSGAAVPYFGNFTLNHDSTADITLNLTAYTIINATFGGAKVNNFTVNGTSTTSGAVYLRIYADTVEVNISDAVSAGGTNLSDQSANVTASDYLQYYTFTMLTANAFNFSLLDELTEAFITENMTLEIISGASAGTYTTSNGTLYLELLTPSDYTIRYYSSSGTNYTQRDYIQTLVDRQRYDIELFGILNDEATDMVVTIKDTSGDPVEGAIVKLLRYYTSCNCYKVVEMATTSAAGESYFVADAYDGHYKFSVEYDGVTEFLSSSPENFVPSNGLISRTITINLGSAYFESFRALTDVARTITYNNDTKGLSFTWNDPSGIVTQGCLYAEYLDGVHYTSVTPVCQSGTTGSVVLTLNNSVASYKYYAELYTSTTYSDYVVFSGVIDKVVANLLNGNIGLGAFLGAGVIMVLALMFSFSAIAVVIVTAVGVIGMGVLGIASLSTVFITGFATLILGLAAYLMRS